MMQLFALLRRADHIFTCPQSSSSFIIERADFKNISVETAHRILYVCIQYNL